MNEAALRARLADCLIDEDEAINAGKFEPARYKSLPDPFPVWGRKAAA